jgi:hypothetical protein
MNYREKEKNEWSKMTAEELTQMYSNAKITSAMALGHTKAELNNIRSMAIKEFMTEKRIEIPTDDMCYEFGVMNGKGTV